MSKSLQLVSVIIPCWNAKAWIRDTLESVASQGYESLDVIVIDDGSTDGTGEIINKEFGFVHLETTSNQGASRARNLGTRLASGKYIQYLDSDDLLARGKINAQVAALEQSDADVAYGDWQRLVPVHSGFVEGETIARRMERRPELELFGDFWCPPAVYLFRRRIVDAVEGWNERLPIIQDARFALDCALHGGEFVYCPGIMAQYRVHKRGSLSSHDSLAFNRDVYRNALEVEGCWRENGGLTEDRMQSLTECLGYVARSSYERDPDLFSSAFADLERLSPGFVPSHPLRLALTSRLFGYRRAEQIASQFRRAKRSFLKG